MDAKGMIVALARDFDEEANQAADLVSWTPLYYWLTKFHGIAPELPSTGNVLWYMNQLMIYINGYEPDREFFMFMDINGDSSIAYVCPVCGEIHDHHGDAEEAGVHPDWNDDYRLKAERKIGRYRLLHEESKAQIRRR